MQGNVEGLGPGNLLWGDIIRRQYFTVRTQRGKSAVEHLDAGQSVAGFCCPLLLGTPGPLYLELPPPSTRRLDSYIHDRNKPRLLLRSGESHILRSSQREIARQPVVNTAMETASLSILLRTGTISALCIPSFNGGLVQATYMTIFSLRH